MSKKPPRKVASTPTSPPAVADAPRFLTAAPIEPPVSKAVELEPPLAPKRTTPAVPMEMETAPTTGKPCPLFDVAVSDNDRFIAVAHDNGIVGLWQPTLAALTKIPAPMIVGRGHTRSVRGLVFEPPGWRDYACLVSGSVDSTIRTWHLGDRTRNAVLRHHEMSVLCLAFDAAGTRLVSGSEDRTIAIASWPDGKLERKFAAHDGSVLSVAVAPNGNVIASGGFDGHAYLWSVAGKQLARIDDDSFGWVWNVRFLDDERIIFTKGPNVIEWTPRTGSRVLYTIDAIYSVQGLAVRGDGAEIAFGDGKDVVTLGLRDLRAQRRSGHAGTVQSVAYLGDGRVASTAMDGALLVWSGADEPDLQLRAGSA